MDKATSRIWLRYLGLTLCSFVTLFTKGQVGEILWEDHFNSLNTEVWAPNIGDGCNINLCGWGNQELQSYESNNVYIADIPGEPGNKALVLEARNEQSGSSRAFTSGKVTTESRLSVHYGLIEIRMRVPNLETGLWPAAWLLGTSNLPWPAKGEIDMMEMGHKAEERERQGYPGVSSNNYAGANAIFQTADGGYGSIAYDVNYNQPYVTNVPMNDRFVTYRLYWEPTQMRFAVEDNGTEYDLYTNPFPLDPEGVTAAFTKPFYLLLNLAIGGNFTDALANNQVTAPLPGKMYVDYVRVSEWNGYGEVDFNYGQLEPESGKFGLFTDNTPVNNSLSLGTDGEIYVWGGTMQEGTTAPFEGDHVIAWETTSANSWFGGGITSLFGKDMSGFVENGSLKFKIKIPANVSFRIGITDNYTNESYVNFPSGMDQYGLTRDGNWGQVEIPLTDLAGLIAFQDISYLFAITSLDGALPGNTFQLAIDDVFWDDGNGSVISLTSISVSPGNATITEGETQQFTAQAFDQNGNPMNASFTWSVSGGSINANGLFSGTSSGNFTITAASGSVQGNAGIAVNPVSSAITLPGTLQAEDYNEGGYYDTSSGNTGGAYRTDDVDIEATGDASGGYNVGWIEAGEWLEYTINSQASSYDLSVRLASPEGNGTLRVEIDGNDVTGTIAAQSTGSWQTYTTVTVSNISIPTGNHTLRIYFETPGLNLNFIELAESSASEGCEQSGPNGDYVVEISEDSSNPTLTFVPGYEGVGNSVTILYYSTDAGSVFPGYLVAPNNPVSINAEAGQTVYFYYTYSVPEGGERNSAADKHSFVVGSCNQGNRILVADEKRSTSAISLFPNPVHEELKINTGNGYFKHLEVLNILGQLIKTLEINSETPQMSLDVSTLKNGVYFIRLNGSAGTETLRFMKK